MASSLETSSNAAKDSDTSTSARPEMDRFGNTSDDREKTSTSPDTPSPSPAEMPSARITRRRGACHACRMRKVRCDGAKPCVTCERTGQECHYPEIQSRPQRRFGSMSGSAIGRPSGSYGHTGRVLGLTNSTSPGYRYADRQPTQSSSYYQRQQHHQFVQVGPPALSPNTMTRPTFHRRDSAISVPRSCSGLDLGLNLDLGDLHNNLGLGLGLGNGTSISPSAQFNTGVGSLLSPVSPLDDLKDKNMLYFDPDSCYTHQPQTNQQAQTPCSLILYENGAGDASGQETDLSWIFDELVDCTPKPNTTGSGTSTSPQGSSSLPTISKTSSSPSSVSPQVHLQVPAQVPTRGPASVPDQPVDLDFSSSSTYGLLTAIQRRTSTLKPTDSTTITQSLRHLQQSLLHPSTPNHAPSHPKEGPDANDWSVPQWSWSTATDTSVDHGRVSATSPDEEANSHLWHRCERVCFKSGGLLASFLSRSRTSRLVRSALRYGPESAGPLATVFVAGVLCTGLGGDGDEKSGSGGRRDEGWWSEFRHPERVLCLARRWLPECRPGSLLKLQTTLLLGGVVAKMVGDDAAVCEFLTQGVSLARELRLLGGWNRRVSRVEGNKTREDSTEGEEVESNYIDHETEDEDDETAGIKAVDFLRKMDVDYAVQHGIVPLVPSPNGHNDNSFASLMHSILLMQQQHQQQQHGSSKTEASFPSPSTLSQPLTRWINSLPLPLSQLRPAQPSHVLQSRVLSDRNPHHRRLLVQYHSVVFLTYAPWLAVASTTPANTNSEYYGHYLIPLAHSAAAVIQLADQPVQEEVPHTGADEMGPLLMTAVCVVVLCLLDRSKTAAKHHRGMMANLGTCCGVFGRIVIREDQPEMGMLDCMLDLVGVLRGVSVGSIS